MDTSEQTDTPARLSISQAAKLVRKSRQTLYEDRDKGRLSVKRDERGKPYVEVAELQRVYDMLDMSTLSETVNSEQPLTSKKDTQDSVLRLEIQMLRERLADKESQIDDLKNERDEWRENAKRAQLLLTHATEQAQGQPEKPREGRLSRAWSILTGKS